MNDTFDCKLIRDSEQILFYSGCYCEGWLLLPQKVLVTDARYFDAVKKQIDGKFKVICGSDVDLIKDELLGKTVAVDYTSLCVSEFNDLKKKGFNLVDGTNAILTDLSVKSKEQILLIQKACEIAQTSFYQTLPFIKEGVSELDVASELEYRFKKHGAFGVSFETIVAFKEGSAIPHHRTDNVKLKNGSAVLMDFGCVYKGFMSDMTRTLYFGSPDEKFKDCYKKVEEIQRLAIEKINDQMTGKEADDVARSKFKEYGLDEKFSHSLGHCIGTKIHEYPTLSPRCDVKLQNGNVFTIEPGVYFDGEFGIRIEDTVTLEGGKVKSFMTDDKKLLLI